MDADEHPDRQRQQGGRPQPVEHPVHRGTENQQQKTAQPHEQGRSRRPSLWLVGEPHRQHRQHRPPQREPAQDRTSDGALLCREERGSDEERSSDQPGDQRAGHDPTNVSPRPRIRVGRTVLALVLGRRHGGGFGSHDGLHSMHSWRRTSRAICTFGACRHLALDDDHRSRSPGGTRVPRPSKRGSESVIAGGQGSDGLDREALWKEVACTLCSSRPRPRRRPRQHALIGYEGTYRRAQCEPACQIPADGSLHRDHVIGSLLATAVGKGTTAVLRRERQAAVAAALLRLSAHGRLTPCSHPGSDRQGEFVERDRHALVHRLLDRELVCPRRRFCTKPCPAITTLALRSCLRPRIAPSRAFSRP